jgi:RNA polymerase sigma-70 factor (ECF subfamily)
MHKVPHNEAELLSLIAQGDQHAYQAIFEKYWDTIYNTVLLLSKSTAHAEDITQDVFTIVWEKRETLPAIEKFEGFLFITARNLIYSRMRKLASDKAYREHLQQYFQERTEETVHDLAAYRELEQTILRTIRHLSPQQQKAFTLSRFQGLPHKEIAGKMGLSHLTIKSYIVQTIVTLRRAISKHSVIILLLQVFF